jgi:hypothetical protein
MFYLEFEISREIDNEVQIINNGILLADKNTEKRILFEAQVLSKYHDWNYFLRRHMGMS